jgi:hypothetical protein
VKSPLKIILLIIASLVGLVLFIHLLGAGCKKPLPAGANLKLGKTETRSNYSSSSTSSASENAGFNSRRVLLFSDNPHPLNRRILAMLEEKLKDSQFIEQLLVTNQPFTFAEGSGLPDLFVNVNLIELKEDGVLSHSMKAVITASLGSTPWQSSSYYQDDSTVPLVIFSWNGTHDSETTFSGIRTDRYGDAARSIANDIAQNIMKQIEELSEKYPPLPDLGRGFYGPYQPVTDFDFLKEVQAQRTASGHGLLTHNQTFWQFRTGTNPVPQLQRILSQLEAVGWKSTDTWLTNTGSYFIRCHRDNANLEIFRQRADRMDLNLSGQRESFMDFVVHYRQPFTRAEREAAVETLFAGERPVGELLPFQNTFTSGQRKRFFELVEKSPATSPRACIQLAQVYLNRKQTNDAIHLLARAKALTAAVKNASTLESSIEDIVKKISPKKPLKLMVTPEICHELGFLEITNLTQAVEQERHLGEPLILFGTNERGVRICSFIVSPPQKDYYPWLRLQAEEGMRSTSSSLHATNHANKWLESFSFNNKAVKITVVPLPDQKKVNFTIEADQ